MKRIIIMCIVFLLPQGLQLFSENKTRQIMGVDDTENNEDTFNLENEQRGISFATHLTILSMAFIVWVRCHNVLLKQIDKLKSDNKFIGKALSSLVESNLLLDMYSRYRPTREEVQKHKNKKLLKEMLGAWNFTLLLLTPLFLLHIAGVFTFPIAVYTNISYYFTQHHARRGVQDALTLFKSYIYENRLVTQRILGKLFTTQEIRELEANTRVLMNTRSTDEIGRLLVHETGYEIGAMVKRASERSYEQGAASHHYLYAFSDVLLRGIASLHKSRNANSFMRPTAYIDK